MAASDRLALAQRIGELRYSPLDHARFAYPWETEALPAPGPRTWQQETFLQIEEHLSNPALRFTPCRIGIASGHGIGKSAGISMINKWALDTCVDTRIVITANTEGQLLTKTGPELAKWAQLAVTDDWFKVNATSIVSTMGDRSKSWRTDLVTWSANNTEAFAGLHNQGKRIVLIFDEASGIIQKVWEVALGALTDEDTEILWLAFGNPTLNTGSFRDCFGKSRNLWKTKQIDSRTVEGTNKAYLQELVDTYGIDSDIVKVRVLGQFPSASSMQFIGMDVVEAAQQRAVQSIGSDPLIYGVDIARFGDDHSTLAKRCGRDAKSRPWKRWYGADTMTVAGDIALEAQQEHPDAIFVDVGAMGAGVIDRLRQLLPETPVFEVNFGGKGRDAVWANNVRVKTKNKRAEMWTSMRTWLEYGAIPEDQGLADDLTSPEYGYDAEQRIELEKKDHMKARGVASPDDADALACTFAEPVAPRAVPGYLNPESYGHAGSYDRYKELY
ncbi:terminase [Sphingomonas sp. BHC-A]|uniref:Terminase n=1 Tax=Sphingobium indicum (strain DSM 16412 / CCM 7286 / MTCC 6364 / B90A) TaxID=861109 RepID=A0A1L5BMV1_SPHIB|nr:terminase [Sphingobium indicum B90A]KEZ00293.1 terminase [Sphingomonas sp. BHC-A]